MKHTCHICHIGHVPIVERLVKRCVKSIHRSFEEREKLIHISYTRHVPVTYMSICRNNRRSSLSGTVIVIPNRLLNSSIRQRDFDITSYFLMNRTTESAEVSFNLINDEKFDKI